VEAKMITTSTGRDSITLQVVGEFNGEWVQELERRWRKARTEGPSVRVDLCGAHEIDGQARNLIAEMFADGVELVVGPCHPRRVQ